MMKVKRAVKQLWKTSMVTFRVAKKKKTALQQSCEKSADENDCIII